MKLRDVEFEPVSNASGARGFFGEGYWFHHLLAFLFTVTRIKYFRLTFERTTLEAKTTTLDSNKGNLAMKADGITPKHWFPDCIIVKFLKGVVLNCLGLSGPGFKFLLNLGRWQKLTEPFFLSFSAIGETTEKRLEELTQFVESLLPELPKFKSSVGLVLNVSCPNTKHNYALDPWIEFLQEVWGMLNIATPLNIPIMVKLSLLVPERTAYKISQHPTCDALCLANTAPYGEFADHIPWKDLFGSVDPASSPLVARGYKAGGYSGPHLLPLVCLYLETLRRMGMKKPIIASGGITSVVAVRKVHQADASAVQLGSVCLTRWWRTQAMITEAHKLFRKENN